MANIRVLYVDDTHDFIHSTSLFLTDNHIKVVGLYMTPTQTLNDVVLMHIAMDSVQTKWLVNNNLCAPLVILKSLETSEHNHLEATDVGVDGFLEKHNLGIDLILLIQRPFPVADIAYERHITGRIAPAPGNNSEQAHLEKPGY